MTNYEKMIAEMTPEGDEPFWDENDTISLTNKDGFLVSDEDLQEQYRQDLNSGLMSKLTYLMKARGMTLEQAQQELALAREDNPQLSDLIGE